MLTPIIFLACGVLSSAIQFKDSNVSINDGSVEFVEGGWTAFGGSDAHTGFKSDYLGPIHGLRTKWSVNVTGTLTYPVVYDNKVFVMSSAGVLHVFDESTGSQLGLLNLGPGYCVGPATIGNDGEEDLAYVYYASNSWDINVYAVKIQNLFDMQVKWIAYGKDENLCRYGVSSSPYSGLVYYPGATRDIVMYGANFTTGETAFATELLNTMYCSPNWALTVDEEGRVFFCSGGAMEGIGYIGEADPLSGDILWLYNFDTFTSECTAGWVPVVYDNIALAVIQVYPSENQAYLLAIRMITRTMLWSTEVCTIVGDADATPAVDGTRAFFSCSDRIRAFDLQTGILVKEYVPCNGCFGQPIVTEDYLFAQSSSGTLVFDKVTGDLVTEMMDGSGKMAYNDGSVYVSVNSTLFAYESFYNNVTEVDE